MSVRVGVPGLEPGTSRTRTVRATGLRYTPKLLKISGTARYSPRLRYAPNVFVLQFRVE